MSNQISIEDNLIKISFPISKSKYIIEIFFPKNKDYINFKAKNIGIASYYFHRNYGQIDLSKKIGNISSNNLEDFFDYLKDIIRRYDINLEENDDKLYLTLDNNANGDNNDNNIYFILKKEYFCQNRINSVFIDKLNNQTKNIKIIEKQMEHFSEDVNKQKNLFNNINSKIDNINNIIKNIIGDFNDINNNLDKALDSQKETDKETTKLLKDNKKETKAKSKRNKISFFFSSKFLFFLNIIFFIIMYHLFSYLILLKEKLAISTEQIQKIYSSLSYFQNIFQSIEDNTELDENEEENIKEKSEIKFNNFINTIKKKDMHLIFFDENLSLNLTSRNMNVIAQMEKYLKKEIINIKNDNKISDVNFILKYTNEYTRLDFYINCQKLKEHLISIQNKNGNLIYIYSNDIINLMNDFLIDDVVNENNNCSIYMFQQRENYNKTKTNEELLEYYIRNVIDFINSSNNYRGEILYLKIYEIEYKTK